MKFYIEFTPFYDYNDKKLTLLYNRFPFLKKEPIVNVHAICWLYNKDAIKGVVLCKHGVDALVLYKLHCFDIYDEKPFITLIRKYVGNDKRITLQAAAADYDRLSSMVLESRYTPIDFIKDDAVQTEPEFPIVESQEKESANEVQDNQIQQVSNMVMYANDINGVYTQLEKLLRVFGDIEHKMSQRANNGDVPIEALKIYEARAFQLLSDYPGKLLIVDPKKLSFDVSEYQKRFSTYKISRLFKQVVPYNPPKVDENKLFEVMSKYPEIFESNQAPEDTNSVDSVISTVQPEPEKRKLEMVEEESNAAEVTYKVFPQPNKDNSELETYLGETINKTEVIHLYEQFATLIGSRHGINMFDMNNHTNYKDFINRNDGDKVCLIALRNGVPVAFMLVRDLTEENDKLKSIQIIQLYSSLKFYKALTYCHFYKWYEQKSGTGSLIRLESPKNDLQFYKEMNMVVDEEWNVLYTGWNHRMAIVGKHIPPYERYKDVLHHTTEKRIKYSNTR